MRELGVLYWNRKTLNTAHIFFDRSCKVKKILPILKKLNIGYTIYVDKKEGTSIIFGIKMFRIKRNFLNLCSELKGVLNE